MLGIGVIVFGPCMLYPEYPDVSAYLIMLDLSVMLQFNLLS